MEEPPKVERLLSSRGISLSNAANILKSYVSIIDEHHGPVVDPSSSSPANNIGQNDTLKSQQQQQQQDDIAEEKEEERLLARRNQLDPTTSNTNNRLGGSISEDVYERLRMIMESVVAESEGRVVSAVGVYAKSKEADGNLNEEGGDGVMEGEVENNGQEDEFMKELEEAERLETEYNQEAEEHQKVEQPKIEEEEPQQQQQKIDYEQKKKDKKAKKAAKKAKKEAKKRKASSGGGDGANEEKRVKVEEDQ